MILLKKDFEFVQSNRSGGKGRCTMLIRQFFVKGLAHNSYLVAGEKMCEVIDPRREVEIYLDAAREIGVRVTYIIEHRALSEGDVFSRDNMEVSVLETPSHTPEHIFNVFPDLSRGKYPVGLFCGDTLFVGDVGRPDLFPGKAEELAGGLSGYGAEGYGPECSVCFIPNASRFLAGR